MIAAAHRPNVLLFRMEATSAREVTESQTPAVKRKKDPPDV
jgi:hypothetical protein